MSTCIHGVNPHASITEISVTDAYRDGMSTRANLYILVPHSYQSFLRTLVSFRGNKLGWTRVESRGQGIPDFQAPPPIPKYIDTVEALDELPSYDSFEPAPDDFQNPLPWRRNGSSTSRWRLFSAD
jgi:hypothetical protein